MFAAWFGKKKRNPEARRKQTFVPRVEGMEERVVPAGGPVRLVAGFDTTTLAAGRDQSSAAVNIGFSIDFYGKTYSQLFVNSAGVSFSTGLKNILTGFTNRFPASLGQTVIAPFWADVDTSKAGSIFYGTGILEGHLAFSVTWQNVGYATGESTPTDFYQMILIDRSDTGAGNFDLEFDYNGVKWDSADTMGGTKGVTAGKGTTATVAFSGGTGQAGTFDIFRPAVTGSDPYLDGNATPPGTNPLNAGTLNATVAGRYHFYFRNGNLITGVTPNVTAYMPFRYAYNAGSQTFTGNLSLVNHTQSIQNVISPQVNLDELLPSSQPSGPVTVEFAQLPRGVTLANETGVTASGHPYITVNTTLGLNATLYQSLVFRDPLNQPLPNFYDTTGILTFLGTFNPAQQ